MPKDRRAFRRLEGVVNIRYAVRGRDTKKIESVPKNIGGGGTGICLTERLKAGTLLELEITAPDNPQQSFLGVGKILWTKPYGTIKSEVGQVINLYETGIKFVDIDPIAIGRVYSYCRRIKRR